MRSLILSLSCLLAVGCQQRADQGQSANGPRDPRGGLVEPAPLDYVGDKIVLGSPGLTSGIAGHGPLTVPELQRWLDDPKVHEDFEFVLPMGLRDGSAAAVVPDDNPLTRAKIELGRQLFFDRRLAAPNPGFSCADCHPPRGGYAHPGHNLAAANPHARAVPGVFNRIFGREQFWDGRAQSLEEQVVQPIATPDEMGSSYAQCVATLSSIPGYRLQFERIFGRLTIREVGQALASFLRALVTGPGSADYARRLRHYEGTNLVELSPLDRKEYEACLTGAKANPLSEAARRGEELFFSERVGCGKCHPYPNLSDEKYHNIGLASDQQNPDPGRFAVTGRQADRGAFKTPTLRGIVETAPYMHRGQLVELSQVIDWYAGDGSGAQHQSSNIKPFKLTADERTDLLAFLRSVSGTLPVVGEGRLPE